MKQLALGCLVVAAAATTVLHVTPVEARGGLNASYARAYCQYYLNKSATVARGHSQKALSTKGHAKEGNRQSPEYWRRAYRECLKENGY